MTARFDQARRVCISAETLSAVAPFASREGVRYYLNGVYVEPHRAQGVLVVATDGHVLAVCHDPDGSADAPWICSAPPTILSAARKSGKGKSAPKTVHFIGAAAHVLSEVDSGYDPAVPGPMHLAMAYAPAIDGTFPEWRKCMPKTAAQINGPGFSINPELFARFAQAGRALGAAGLTLLTGASKADPIGVYLGNCQRFFGVIMPMNVVRSVPLVGMALQPEWLEEAPKQAAAE
jgi:hypothetical protein